MTYQTRGTIAFPEFTGARCYMMPMIQGRPESLPAEFSGYADAVERFVMAGEEGQLGYITIDESFVESGKSQRGYGAGERTLHTEACRSEKLLTWGPTWGPAREDPNSPGFVELARDLRVVIANSIADTCMVWDVDVLDTTFDGDLSLRAAEFPRSAGRMMAAGEVMEIGIFTPHEPIPQPVSGERQFFRIVGKGVYGREPYFTLNPVLDKMRMDTRAGI